MSVVESGQRLFAHARRLSKSRSGSAATLQTFLATVVVQVLNTLTGIITARCLGPAGRGENSAMVMWPFFLAYCMTLGLPSALLYNIKRESDPEKRRSLFSAALWLGAALGTLSACVGIWLVPRYLGQYPPQVAREAQWLMLLTPTTLVGLILYAVLQAREEFQLFNRLKYLSPFFSLVGLLAIIALHKATPFMTALAFSLAGTPIFLWTLVYLVREYRPHFRDLGDTYRKLLHYGLRSYGVDLLNTLAVYLDQALVVGLLVPRMMGLYTVALSLSRMLNVFQTSVVNVLFSKATGRPHEEVIAITGRAARISAALTALAAILAMGISPILLRLLYGKEYLEAVAVFRIFVVEVTVSSTVWVLGQAFMAMGRPGLVTVLQSLGVGLSFPLMLVLIPRFGLIGAGFAILGSTTVRLIFILGNFPLTLKVPPPGLLITRADIEWARHSLRR